MGGDKGEVLDQAAEHMPARHSNAMRKCLSIVRVAISGMQYINDLNNDPNSVRCIDSKIKEINNISNKLNGTLATKQKLDEGLSKARETLNYKALDRINPDQITDNEFAHIMYEKLLDHYIRNTGTSSLLYEDIKNNDYQVVRNKILKQINNVDVDMMATLLEYAIGKGDKADVKVVSTLIINLAHVHNLCEGLLSNCENEEVRNLRIKSRSTILIDVHDSLFNFDDELVNLVSLFPTKSGKFSRKNSEDVITLIGSEGKYDDMVKKLNDLKKELDNKKTIWENQCNRDACTQYMIGFLLDLMRHSI
ncbi:MAG: hypothetical protein PG981_000328 [Wolbachia endosymbiont of Ctenocephalides orientis wCori]|nr:MAG: hypothetical protein PG981_000328 [Wolbachia endosymbiont of Ctenocephalides orientis wCori]